MYRNESCRDKEAAEGAAGHKMPCEEPCPRFAHQLVYDYVKKVAPLFLGYNKGSLGQ